MTTALVMNPRDGTVIENLTDQPNELLAHVAHELRTRERELNKMRAVVEAELTDRMTAEDRQRLITDHYEIQLEGARSREWDPDALEAALRQLVDDGTLHAGELTGILTHQVKVDRKAAQRVLGTLQGRPLALLEGCFRWEKGRARLVVTPITPLLPE